MSADIQAVGDPVDAIRTALAAGPTPGPWTAMSRGAYWNEEEADVRDAEGHDLEAAEFILPPGDVFTTRGQVYMRDAAYMAACNPQAMAVVLERLDTAERENDLLREHASDKISSHTLMTGMSVGHGGIDMGLQGGAASLLAESFAKQFKDSGGVNYVELQFTSKEEIPGERFVVTLQRVQGLTPTQKLAACQAAIDKVRDVVARYRAPGDGWETLTDGLVQKVAAIVGEKAAEVSP